MRTWNVVKVKETDLQEAGEVNQEADCRDKLMPLKCTDSFMG